MQGEWRIEGCNNSVLSLETVLFMPDLKGPMFTTNFPRLQQQFINVCSYVCEKCLVGGK